ncbi:hypothetical protein D3C71_1751420 [compost metagenome]
MRLFFLGGDFRAVQHEQHLAGLDPVPLAHFQLGQPGGDLGGHVDGVGVGHALQLFGRGAPGQPQPKHHHDRQHQPDEDADPAFFRRRRVGRCLQCVIHA